MKALSILFFLLASVPAFSQHASTNRNEAMFEKDILFNGKLPRYFTISDFTRVFGEADSTRLLSVEQPCSYIFSNKDGSKDPSDKYLYKNGSRFENSGSQVAVDELRFSNGNFILYKGRRLSALTTLSELKQLFPNAVSNMGTLNVQGEGYLQVIKLQEDETGTSDGHIKIFIKNSRLYYMHWWFPC